MYRILKFSYWLSIPAFMACLLYVYAMLPDQIGVLYNENGQMDFGTDKSILFYAMMGLFIGVNFFIRIYQNISQKHYGFEPNDFDEISSAAHVYHWLTGLALFLNFAVALVLLFVGIYHSRDIDANQYLFLLFVGPLSLGAWFFYGCYLKFFKK